VRAIAPSTLLVLDEARFRRLLGRSPALRAAVRDSAATRGVDLGDILDSPAAG
jgi:CPA1 family monovalent cation:H+ antiporter